MLCGLAALRHCRLAAGKAFEHRAYVVHMLDVLRIQRGHDEATARRIAQDALIAQKQKRLLHRLSGDTQFLSDLLLDDAFTRR